MSSRARLVIYTRLDCSLCERMEAGVRELIGPGAQLEIVAIDGQPELVARFGADIPVLCVDDEVVCRHFLDARRLQSALAPSS